MKKTILLAAAAMAFAGAWASTTPVIVSSQVRASDPTVLDVVYRVTSDKPTVNVRALAFQDGERNFFNVVRATASRRMSSISLPGRSRRTGRPILPRPSSRF